MMTSRYFISFRLLALFLVGFLMVGTFHLVDANEEPKVSNARKLENKVIGGSNATAARYPYYTWIKMSQNSWCGGSLIAPDVVLTAAHCIAYPFADSANTFSHIPEDPLVVDVWVNSSSREYSEYQYYRKSSNLVVHSDFFMARTNDIALVFLDKPVMNVPLVKINRNSNLPSKTVRSTLTVIGLGATNLSTGFFGGTSTTYAQTLQQGLVTSTPYLTCIKMLHSSWVKDSDICASDEGGTGSCYGDSGGPLLIPTTSAKDDVQVGIVSRGTTDLCVERNFPDMYVRVSFYAKWIDKQICQYSQLRPSSCPPIKPTRAPTKKPSRKPANGPVAFPPF